MVRRVGVKFGVAGIIIAIFALFVFEMFTAMIPDFIPGFHTWLFDRLEWIHRTFQPPQKENAVFSFWSVIFFCGITAVFLVGITSLIGMLIKVFRKQTTKIEFKSYCEQELGDAINVLEQNRTHNRVTDDKVVSFMKAFEMETQNVFNVGPKDIRCFWVVPDSSRTVKLIYLSDDNDTDNEDELIKAAMLQDDVRIVDKYVKQRKPNGEIEQFAIVKNFGNFKLGFSIFLYKDGIMNEENLQKFENMTSYYLLLGFYSKFVTSIKRRAS